MPEPCKFPSLDRCQNRFRWTHKGFDLAPHSDVGLELQVGDVKKFFQALSFKGLCHFVRISKQGPCLTTIEEDGGGKRLITLELAFKADRIAPPDPV